MSDSQELSRNGLFLLRLLEDAGGEPVGEPDLRQILSVGSKDLEREVTEVRRLGYVVERVPLAGIDAYQLLEVPDRLFVHEIRWRLSTRWLGERIQSLTSCTSTNDVGKELALGDAPSGTLVVAEEQTAGRGRRGRRWHSPPGVALYLSFLYRPDEPPESAAALQIATAVSVAHAVMRITGKPARIRWPNDILMGGRKVAGLLTDVVAPGTPAGVYVVGIGLNVLQTADDFPEEIREQATSLRLESGRETSRLDVLPTVLTSIEAWYDRLASGKMDEIAAAWKPLSTLLGRRVRVERGDGEVEGRVTDLSLARGLKIERPEGAEWIPAEHVNRIRPSTDEKATG